MAKKTSNKTVQEMLTKVNQNIRNTISELIKDPNLNTSTLNLLSDLFLTSQRSISSTDPGVFFTGDEIEDVPPVINPVHSPYTVGASGIGNLRYRRTKSPEEEQIKEMNKLMKQAIDMQAVIGNPPPNQSLRLFENADILEKLGDKDLATRCRNMAIKMLDEYTSPPVEEDGGRRIDIDFNTKGGTYVQQ